jgi:hypothetical protein
MTITKTLWTFICISFHVIYRHKSQVTSVQFKQTLLLLLRMIQVPIPKAGGVALGGPVASAAQQPELVEVDSDVNAVTDSLNATTICDVASIASPEHGHNLGLVSVSDDPMSCTPEGKVRFPPTHFLDPDVHGLTTLATHAQLDSPFSSRGPMNVVPETPVKHLDSRKRKFKGTPNDPVAYLGETVKTVKTNDFNNGDNDSGSASSSSHKRPKA